MSEIPEYWQEAVSLLCKNDHVMKKIIETYRGETMTKRNNAFVTLARSITGQQISVKAAASVWKKMENNIGEVTPKSILDCSENTLRESGFSRQKISYLKHVAETFSNGGIDPKELAGINEEEAITELTKLRGVGKWTAEMFLIFHLLKPDIFPVDDIGLQKAIKLHYNVDKGNIHSVGNKWKPYRSVATWYLWRSLDPEPVEY